LLVGRKLTLFFSLTAPQGVSVCEGMKSLKF
jgi:hypothetical protein